MCGIVGIFGHPEAAKLSYLGLYALQHRGQESGGIVTGEGTRLLRRAGMGHIADVFSKDVLDELPGTSSIGHVRYSTAGDSNPASMWRKYQAYQREVEQVPGVRSVAWGGALPFGGSRYEQSFQIDGDPPRPPADRDGTGYQIVSPSYLPLLGVALLEGRGLSDGDTATSPQVCLVDEEFARRFLRGRQTIGTRISTRALHNAPAATSPGG